MNISLRKVLAVALLTVLSASAAAETVIATEKTKVYQSPDKSSKAVSISAGTTMEKTAEKDGWYRVEKDGVTAYIRASQVEEVKEYGGAKGYVAEKTVLYKSYGGGKELASMPAGAEVKVYSVAGDWAYVKYDGEKGYCDLDDLSKKAPAVEVEDEGDDSADDGVIDMNGVTAYAVQGAKVYKSYSTSSKVLAKLDLNDTVKVDAVKDGWCRVEKNGKTAFMRMDDLSTSKFSDKEEEEESSSRVKEMDWWTSGIQSIFARGVTATITDVETGISWQEIRKGGTNHADVQPCTAEDTAKLKQVYGGKWSWNRRAIWVTINGETYAASMNGMPHGGDSVANNNFDGHHCIHFTNSRTHTGNRLDADHQAMVQKALKAGK
ncbi:MAG: hypothetical protein IJ466_03395 [Clostridia bacterium]|nr:hypothetical protein [Clostridia bacterium]